MSRSTGRPSPSTTSRRVEFVPQSTAATEPTAGNLGAACRRTHPQPQEISDVTRLSIWKRWRIEGSEAVKAAVETATRPGPNASAQRTAPGPVHR